jgi:hypothetical protein
VFLVEQGRESGSMKRSDRVHIEKNFRGSCHALSCRVTMNTRSGIMRERDANLVRAQPGEMGNVTRKCVNKCVEQ